MCDLGLGVRFEASRLKPPNYFAVLRLPSAVCRLASGVWRLASGVWRLPSGVFHARPVPTRSLAIPQKLFDLLYEVGGRILMNFFVLVNGGF